jgi:5-methylcytosine-specific restriction protein A
MPKAPRLCPHPGCTNLVRFQRYCLEHRPAPWSRGRTVGQGSTYAWRTVRRQVLTRDRYQCQLAYPGCTRHATIVDHIDNLAARGVTRRVALNANDCAAVCAHCHRIKTAREAAAGRRR